MALNRVIIDTDPGVDDTLALLLALTAKPEELEILLISVTYGNVEVESCLKNVVALFHVLDRELKWREARGQLPGFDTMKSTKPIVAVGPSHPLEDEKLALDYYHGVDGLAGVHTSHPHLSPADTWKELFKSELPVVASDDLKKVEDSSELPPYFTPSKEPAHKEMLRLLRENSEDSITIVALGPLTNLALAAAEDPETFLRVKEVVVMGGAIEVEGNVTPVAEFNTFADAVASARVFALTSRKPASTMPPLSKEVTSLPAYPANLSKMLNLTLMPLDITTPHELLRDSFDSKTIPLIEAGSPLAEWVAAFIGKTFDKEQSRSASSAIQGLALHDPLCLWYMLTRAAPSWMGPPKGLEDIRIETTGHWTRGMHVVDRRNRRKPGNLQEQVKSPGAVNITNPMESLTIGENNKDADPEGDDQGWLTEGAGNRINRIVSSPGEDAFGPYMLERIFG